MNQIGAFKTLLESAAGMELPEWSMVADAVKLRTYDPGGTVFLQDVEHPFVYAVRTGLLKLCYLSEDGIEWVKSFASEGRAFASMTALRPHGRTSFLVTAIETSVIEGLDYRLLRQLAQSHLAWSQALHSITLSLAERKETRERELLTLDAQGRYVAFCLENPNLVRRISQKDLARHLGVTPVGLNRIAMRLRRREPSAAGSAGKR